MEQEIREYIRKVIEIGANIREGDGLIIYMPEEVPEIERIILELKDEYKIADIVFIKENYERIYNFLATDPSDEEILKFIRIYRPLKQSKRVIRIHFSSLIEHCPYYKKLISEYPHRYARYYQLWLENAGELSNQIKSSPLVFTSCPSLSWTSELFGDNQNKDRLWNLITKTIPSTEEVKQIITQQQEIAKYLNELKIETLRFMTDSGTDFSIKLAKASRWITANQDNPYQIFSNFPTYEIYTAPNRLSAEGKIVLTKPSWLDGGDGGYRVNEAELSFSKGKLIKCQSDNIRWSQCVKLPSNDLNRIGEVALVPHQTPITALNQTFYETLLDENTGCHIALGNSYNACIDIPENLLHKNGKKQYGFHEGDWHQDLPFGDESICVEATSSRGGKRLLMKKGKWNF